MGLKKQKTDDLLVWLRERCKYYGHRHADCRAEFDCAVELLLRVRMLPISTIPNAATSATS